MGEAKFTKGPWLLEHDSDTASVLQVFSDNDAEKGDPNICRIQSEHNAHLIAAAPEMYEMLKEISDYSKRNGDYLLPFHAEDIDNLLAKARGES